MAKKSDPSKVLVGSPIGLAVEIKVRLHNEADEQNEQPEDSESDGDESHKNWVKGSSDNAIFGKALYRPVSHGQTVDGESNNEKHRPRDGDCHSVFPFGIYASSNVCIIG